MKTILVTAILTVVFLVGLTFIESKRQENLNRIALEYQQALTEVSTNSSSTSSDDENESGSTIEITLSGAINNEGKYSVDQYTFLYEVIEKAGGLSDEADDYAYNGDYVLEKSMEIYIPKTNNNNKISINSADALTLDLLPGIGSTLANRIVEYRDSNGNFEILENIKSVDGIGDALYKKIRDYIKL